jgi:hypothetical protein
MLQFANLIGDNHGINFAPIEFEVADDLSYWSATIPGKVVAKAEALTGPMTPTGKRVQTVNHFFRTMFNRSHNEKSGMQLISFILLQ